MFERFTDKGRKIIILAREEAERHQNDYLGTEHHQEDGPFFGTDSIGD